MSHKPPLQRSPPPGGVLLLVAAIMPLVLLGCASVTPAPSGSPASARQALIRVDTDFALLAVTRSVAEAFAAYAAEDATLLPMGAQPVRGREAIRKLMAEDPDTQLRWTVKDAQVAASGDLGYTWGVYEVHIPSKDGPPVVRHGKYVTVWKRQKDGAWKYVMDIGNLSPNP